MVESVLPMNCIVEKEEEKHYHYDQIVDLFVVPMIKRVKSECIEVEKNQYRGKLAIV